jgi:4-hydroxy-tetrahydrodipicolinate synthase
MGLVIRKYSLAKQGVIAHPTLRKPAPLLTQDAIREIDALAQRQDRRLQALDV